MSQGVEIEFDCLPLRVVGRVDAPLDESPAYRDRCERIARAIATHGTFNTYFLYNASCTFHLTNDPALGLVRFRFQGVVLTDETDQKTVRCDLDVELDKETCDWLTEPIVAWFKETVAHAVRVEFDFYIAAGDLAQTVQRVERIRSQADQQGGYVGMYL